MAMNLNKVQIIGNMTRDPELRTTTGGHNVTSFSVATSRRWKDKTSGEQKEHTEFHNVVAWGRLSDIVSQYLHKGSKVYVEGRLQTRSWEDQTGAKKYRTEIVAENIIMLDRAGSVPGAKAAEPTAPAPRAPAEEEINVEDIPF
ncbi:MAG: single-stranded DNA-binding protein [Candidatus Kerfeldbacteria bacterium]|nr:single-stranded DNA-binding protein [Candidatus Kerfeldbacteria bacterium]